MEHGINFKDLKIEKSFTKIQTQILSENKIENIDDYLKKDFDKIPSPFLLPDFIDSILLIYKNLTNNSKILLYGDRDTDGVTSTSILALYLRKRTNHLVVKNSSHGDDYGLCQKVVDFILQEKPNLLITLDFGTSNFEEINLISEKGISVIVVDHHEIPKKIPNCKLVNPKREDSIYPEEKICTAVIASKIVLALLILEKLEKEKTELFFNYQEKLNSLDLRIFFLENPEILNEYKLFLSLAAVGTITDMMPLKGENRILVSEGLFSILKVLKTEDENFIGVKTFFENLNLNPNKISSKDLGWTIGPMLNAAGRMGQTELATKLLLSKTKEEAKENSTKLKSLNEERKERTKRNLYKVEEYFKRKKERAEKKVIFCYEPDLEPGVSGIVATKLVEQYKKPSIFITPEHGIAKGSIRSYKTENVLEFLEMFSDLLLHYGGHKEAGGFTLEPKNISELEIQIEAKADIWLGKESKIENLKKSLISFNATEFNEKVFEEIQIFQPFGMENEEPLFSIQNAKIINLKPMSENKHAKFQVLGVSPKIHFVVWNKAKELIELINKNSEVQLFGYLEENYFKSSTSIQFIVKEFKK